MLENNYEFHLVFFWLPSVDMALSRVADRVRRGGHDVPEETIRRRYRAGLKNFFTLYQPLATAWQMMDNSGRIGKVIASGSLTETHLVADEGHWRSILASFQS